MGVWALYGTDLGRRGVMCETCRWCDEDVVDVDRVLCVEHAREADRDAAGDAAFDLRGDR